MANFWNNIKKYLFTSAEKQKVLEAQAETDTTTTETTEADLSINQLPFIKGSNNQTALDKTIPFVMGRTFLTPYKLNDGFYSISGDNGEKQYYNVPLVCGYNNQKIESVSIGDTKIKEFDTSAVTSQDGVYNIEHATLGNISLEIKNSGELTLDGLNQKVIGQYYGEEVVHNFEESAEDLIKELSENPMRVEVCIKFDGLRAYNSDTGAYEPRSVKVTPYWSNNADSGAPEWHEMSFDIVNDGSKTYQEVELTDEQKETALENGYILSSTVKVYTDRETYVEVPTYYSNNSDYSVNLEGSLTTSTTLADWTVKHKETVSGTNIITRNTKDTCRFTASYTFNAAEAYGKNISIKLVKDTPAQESNSNETCILEYINTYCYDSAKSSSTELVACMPLEQPFRDQTLRLGLKFEANSTTDNLIEELNIITYGCARIYDGVDWHSYKEPTSNPASWILEVLTNSYHNISKYTDNEIDLTSLGALYTYCNENELECNGVVTSGTKKGDIISDILTLCFSEMIINDEGLLSFVIDKAETVDDTLPLINEQNVINLNYAKTFEREITGYKTTYTDSESWSNRTDYFFKEENHTYNQLTDTLTEISYNYLTKYAQAYKLTQRDLRKAVLQPRTLTLSLGAEAQKYNIYDLLYVSLPRLKKGLVSTVIHAVTYNDAGLITGFELADEIEFVSDYRYGILVQAQNDNGRNIFKAEITGTGKTKTVTLTDPAANSVIINYGNIASVGLLNTDGSYTSIYDVMRIYDISADSDNTYTVTLKDYSAELYEYGTIPEYKSNLTRRPTTAQTLPTLTQVDIDEARHDNWTQTKELVKGLEEQIEGLQTDTTLCSMDLSSFVIEIDNSGYTLTSQSFTTNISLRHNEDELDFIIDSIENLPDGFTYTINGKAVTITVGENAKVSAGTLKIVVKYYPVSKYIEYVDKDGNNYVDKDGKKYVHYEYATTYTEWPLYLTYMAAGYGVFLGTFSNLSDIPSTTNIGDYFVWGGENKKASSLAYDGYFLQAQTYKYVGNSKSYSWEVDTNTGNMQAALSDVLNIANADLKTNNSTVWAYLDHLTSNSVYADMIVANEAFIEKLAAKIITADLVTTEVLATTLQSYEKINDLTELLKGYATTDDLDDYETKTDLSANFPTKDSLTDTLKSYTTTDDLDTKLASYATKDAIKDMDTITARNTALNNYVQSTSIFGTDGHILSDFATESISYAMVNGETVIKNGFINTNCLNADVVTTTLLEADTLTVKGTVYASEGRFSAGIGYLYPVAYPQSVGENFAIALEPRGSTRYGKSSLFICVADTYRDIYGYPIFSAICTRYFEDSTFTNSGYLTQLLSGSENVINVQDNAVIIANKTKDLAIEKYYLIEVILR